MVVLAALVFLQKQMVFFELPEVFLSMAWSFSRWLRTFYEIH